MEWKRQLCRNEFHSDGSALGKANERPQAFDQLRSLILRQARAGGIDKSRQLLPAGPALPDLIGPNGDL
jgi:hypothetical protein